VNSISQFLHLVKAKIEKTLWEKRYVRFGLVSSIDQRNTLFYLLEMECHDETQNSHLL
jgi:hypothetical protein